MTTCKLGDGSLTIEDDAVTLAFSGMLTQAVKKKASPRRIPFTAIADVELKKPTIGGGYLRFVLAGSDPNEKFKPLADLNTLTLAAGKTYEAALSVIDTLRERIGGTEAVPDPDLLSTVRTAPNLVPAGNRGEDKAPPTGSRKEDKKEILAREASADGTRPDIAEAASRMSWTLGGKREIRKLHEHIHDSETVRHIAQGTYEEHQGVVVLTDQRLLFVFLGWINQRIEDFPLDRITAVGSKGGFSTGKLVIHTGGAQSTIGSVVNADLKYLVDAVRKALTGGSVSAESKSGAAQADIMDQLRKLGELRDSGVLTQEEFDSKKTELLNRI
jgi:hypothetical protein